MTDIEGKLRWSATATLGRRLIGITRSLVIARVVGPESFGVFAGVVAFTMLGGLVAELGAGSYLVHRSAAARRESGAVARMVAGSGVVTSLVLAMLAIPVAAVYGEPRAAAVMLALAPSVTLTVLTAVPLGVLRAEFRFRTMALGEVGGEVLGSVVGVVLAVSGAGVWSLVVAALAAQVVTLTVLWSASGIGIPKVDGLGRQTRSRALRYGLFVAAGAFVWAIALHGDNVIVGHKLGAASLGLYAFAYSYGLLPGTLVGSTVGQVAFPLFALRKGDAEGLRQHFIRFTRLTAMTALPLVAIAIALVAPFVNWLLGPAWRSAVVPLQIILAMGAVRGLYPSSQVLQATGKVGVELYIGLLAAPATLLAASLGTRWGITGVAGAVSVVLVATALAAALISARVIDLPPWQLIAIPSPLVPAASVAAASAWLVSHIESLGLGSRAVLGMTVGLGLYLVILRRFLRRSWVELRSLVRLGVPAAEAAAGPSAVGVAGAVVGGHPDVGVELSGPIVSSPDPEDARRSPAWLE